MPRNAPVVSAWTVACHGKPMLSVAIRLALANCIYRTMRCSPCRIFLPPTYVLLRNGNGMIRSGLVRLDGRLVQQLR